MQDDCKRGGLGHADRQRNLNRCSLGSRLFCNARSVQIDTAVATKLMECDRAAARLDRFGWCEGCAVDREAAGRSPRPLRSRFRIDPLPAIHVLIRWLKRWIGRIRRDRAHSPAADEVTPL